MRCKEVAAAGLEVLVDIIIKMAGTFITLYGINNIGKSTQAKLLVERLNENGREAVYVKYPVYDIEPTGPFINKVLRGGEQKISEAELQMWFCLNRHQYEEQIRKDLDAGKIVIAEDYTGTGIAWGNAKGLDLEWLEMLNKDLLREDVSILMQGQRFMEAKETGHVHEENEDLVEKCRVVHEQLADRYGWTRFEVVEGIEKCADQLWDLVNKHLQ